MKKIDFHIHTVPTDSDAFFNFDLANLKKYVSKAKLDAIAITNHNMFDGTQFRTIKETLGVVVFPGIEVSLDCGHILIISDGSDLENFESKTGLVAHNIPTNTDSITVKELKAIFGDLNDYLVIPHYGKDPSINSETLDLIACYVSAGEVSSVKKFIHTIKDEKMLAPVLFSDVRISDESFSLPTRQTYINCGELTLSAVKTCLQDKKVALSKTERNKLFQVFEDGQKLSPGLSVLLGERSSGKTYTLDKINKLCDNVKYIKQFSLVQQNDEADEREFNRDLQRKQSRITEDYLSEFKVVLNDVINVDLRVNNREVEDYVSTLLEFAEYSDRRDSYANTALFNETLFLTSDYKLLFDLISSVEQVIENGKYREIISKHVDIDSMKRLARELIELHWEKTFEKKKKTVVNDLIRDIKERLQRRTAAVQVKDVDLYHISMDNRKVERFTEIVKCLQKAATISEENIRGFRVVVRKGAFAGAGEIKSASRVQTAFQGSYKIYGRPYDYLRSLLDNESLTRSELYKLFAKISYRILNKDGAEVSGGERSEFRLLQEIDDAQNYDFLLIDEPESSFDNLFLMSDVNQIIREISSLMPVVVVTHNNTVGASIEPDYLLYARKVSEGDKVDYSLYSGYPTDPTLMSLDGRTISNYEIILNSLEAGCKPYNDRKQRYEAIRD